MSHWTWWEMAMFVMKTLATAVACGVCIYACKLTNFWRGWVLLTIGLMTAPFIGVFQILGLLELPAPHTWDKLTGVYLPFVSMMFVSFGAWEVVRKIRIILRRSGRGISQEISGGDRNGKTA